MSLKNLSTKNFWSTPWGLKQNFFIILGLWIVGGALEFVGATHSVHLPLICILFLFWTFCFKIPFFYPLIEWSRGKNFSITILASLGLLTLFAAFTPNSVVTIKSWPWFLTLILALQSHFFIITKARWPLRLSFFLHFGALLVMLFGYLAANSLTRTTIELRPKEKVSPKELPFALELKKFDIEYFPAELVIARGEKIEKKLGTIDKITSTFTWNNHSFTINDSTPFAIEFAGNIHRIDHPSATPMVWLSISNKQKLQQKITLIPGAAHALESDYILALNSPKPKKYTSLLNYYLPTDAKKTPHEYFLSVNHPLKIGQWTIYQHSYDSSMGKWSAYSMVEAVYDPWLPFVYLGFIIILLSSCLLLWKGDRLAVINKNTITARTTTTLASRLLLALKIVFTVAAGIYLASLWIKLARPPMKTLGETRLWYIFLLPAIGLLVDYRLKSSWVSSYSLFLSLLFLGICYLHPEQFDQTLAPALQSPWFIPHVIVYMLAYALLAMATLFAIRGLAKKEEHLIVHATALVHAGFALLTMGLLFGALWAKTAWGHYWSWDPKETWALLTWMLYLLFIHFRLFERTKIIEAQLLLLLNFIILLLCWFGINYLPIAANSVHTYTS
ncbi:MAG: cytochrome c biogenesis protein CcsA [Oligoflexia bacterium]|nr:cytochrome c biogenesis protein CcsA [Oligoflexia bacterium]